MYPRQRVSAGHRFISMEDLAMRVIEITSEGNISADFCGVFICEHEFDEIICRIGSS